MRYPVFRTPDPKKNKYATEALQASPEIRGQTGIDTFDIALTLGSGRAKAAELIGETVSETDATEVPAFFGSGVPGHKCTTPGCPTVIEGTSEVLRVKIAVEFFGLQVRNRVLFWKAG